MPEPEVPEAEAKESSDEAVAVDNLADDMMLAPSSALAPKRKPKNPKTAKKDGKKVREAKSRKHHKNVEFAGAGARREKGGKSLPASERASTAAAPSVLGSMSLLDNEVASSGSNAGSRSVGKGSSSVTGETPEEQLQFHMQALCITQTLEGVAMGREKWHATNFALKFKDTVPGVLMQGHLDLYYDACKLLPANIQKTSEAERQRILKSLAAADITIPVHVRPGLLAVHLRSHSPVDRVAPLNPWGDGQPMPFDPFQPTLFRLCSWRNKNRTLATEEPHQRQLVRRKSAQENLEAMRCFRQPGQC